MGPFFARLADWLEGQGQTVHKVQFNGGDRLFYRRRRDVHDYQGRHQDLGAWLSSMLVLHRIDAIVLFGQHRPVHEVAREVAGQLRVPVFVFEEGYLRPDYVTLERGGVNGYSGVPRDAASYRAFAEEKDLPRPQPTHQRFALMAWYATLYSVAMLLLWPRYRHHVYHRPLSPLAQALAWTRGGVRKLWHGWSQRKLLDVLQAPGRSRGFFLLPLQVHNDSQILHHSPYDGIEAVIDDVMTSFARHANAAHWLVIKHHPMDRAYRSYARHIRERTAALGLSGRVLYVHDLHLPTLLRHARGVVTVNSTTGLQALFHRAPVAVLGECFYAIPGLVYGGSLAQFWRYPGWVDAGLFQQFRHYLLRHNQINTSFYGRAPAFDHPVSLVADSEERPSLGARQAGPSMLAPGRMASQVMPASTENAPVQILSRDSIG